MKRITLLLVGLFLVTGIPTQAKTIDVQKNETASLDNNPEKRRGRFYRNAEPVLFSMKGVDFAVYPDGYLEFETRNGRRHGMYARTGRRGGNRYGNLNSRNRFIRYDRHGNLKWIGNMRVKINNRGQIKKIGRVKVNYRNRIVNKVGGLRVKYNRRGHLIFARGNVKYWIYGAGNQTHIDDQNFSDPWDSGTYFEKNKENRRLDRDDS